MAVVAMASRPVAAEAVLAALAMVAVAAASAIAAAAIAAVAATAAAAVTATEMVVGASLLAAVFLPFGLHSGPVAGFILYVLKVLFVVALLSLSRTVVARLRIDQMIEFCWKYLVPLAMVQLMIDLVIRGVI